MTRTILNRNWVLAGEAAIALIVLVAAAGPRFAAAACGAAGAVAASRVRGSRTGALIVLLVAGACAVAFGASRPSTGRHRAGGGSRQTQPALPAAGSTRSAE